MCTSTDSAVGGFSSKGEAGYGAVDGVSHDRARRLRCRSVQRSRTRIGCRVVGEPFLIDEQSGGFRVDKGKVADMESSQQLQDGSGRQEREGRERRSRIADAKRSPNATFPLPPSGRTARTARERT